MSRSALLLNGWLQRKVEHPKSALEDLLTVYEFLRERIPSGKHGAMILRFNVTIHPRRDS